jgi:hypothetical protein
MIIGKYMVIIAKNPASLYFAGFFILAETGFEPVTFGL